MAYDFTTTMVADRQRALLATAAAVRARRDGHPSRRADHPVRARIRSWFRTTPTAASPPTPRAVTALSVSADRTSAETQGKAA